MQQTAKKRVLVVDDDPSIRALVVGMLSQRYAVEQAPDGQSALAKMDELLDKVSRAVG